MNNLRPIIRYHGSKWRLAPWIMQHFPAHSTYVEPFGGSAAVLLQKSAARQDIYNDLDKEIVNVFRVMRNPSDAKKLKDMVFLTPHSRDEYNLSYDPTDDPIEMARRTLVRSFMGFGSSAVTNNTKCGFRNRRDGSSGPSREWSNYSSFIPRFVERLRTVTLECIPAVEVIKKYDSPSTLFYVDPPYVLETRNSHCQCYRYEMSDDEHCSLAHLLNNIQGFAVVSGYISDLYSKLYSDWHSVNKETRADGAASRTETIWLSPKTYAVLNNRTLFSIL